MPQQAQNAENDQIACYDVVKQLGKYQYANARPQTDERGKFKVKCHTAGLL
jgi:hypothetical protein